MSEINGTESCECKSNNICENRCVCINNNVIKYILRKDLRIDTYTYGVMKTNQPDFLLVTGYDKSENALLAAVSDLVPVRKWLGDTKKFSGGNVFERLDRLTNDLSETLSFFDEYMIPSYELKADIDCVFYDDGKGRCRFLCLPVIEETAKTPTVSQLFPAAVCSAEYENDKQKAIAMDIAGFLLKSGRTSCGADACSIRSMDACSTRGKDACPPDTVLILEQVSEKLRAAAVTDTAVKRKKAPSFLTRLFSAQSTEISDDEFFFEEEAPSKMEILPVLTCRSTGAQYPLIFGPDYLGTDPEKCSICIDCDGENDKDVVFCKMSAKRGKWFIKNLAKSEKIFINGEEISMGYECEMKPADIITIGKTDFVFSHGN